MYNNAAMKTEETGISPGTTPNDGLADYRKRFNDGLVAMTEDQDCRNGQEPITGNNKRARSDLDGHAFVPGSGFSGRTNDSMYSWGPKWRHTYGYRNINPYWNYPEDTPAIGYNQQNYKWRRQNFWYENANPRFCHPYKGPGRHHRVGYNRHVSNYVRNPYDHGRGGWNPGRFWGRGERRAESSTISGFSSNNEGTSKGNNDISCTNFDSQNDLDTSKSNIGDSDQIPNNSQNTIPAVPDCTIDSTGDHAEASEPDAEANISSTHVDPTAKLTEEETKEERIIREAEKRKERILNQSQHKKWTVNKEIKDGNKNSQGHNNQRAGKKQKSKLVIPWYVKKSKWVWQRHYKQKKCQMGHISFLRWVYLKNGLLWNICRILGLPCLDSLLARARKRRLILQPSKEEKKLMSHYEKANGIAEVPHEVLPESRIAYLICEYPIMKFVEGMSKQQRKELLTDKMCNFLGKEINDETEFTFAGVEVNHSIAVDSHLDMDELLAKTKGKDYKSALSKSVGGTRSIELEFVVASFSSPDSWPKDALRDELLLDPMIKVAIGWSPMVTTIPSEQMLIKNFGDQLRMPGVVAAGEVGLRYCKETTAEEREMQMEILKQILPVVHESHLPVIVTCEGKKQEFSAMEDCFSVLKEFLPRSYPVYITSFQGNVKILNMWRNHFSNVKFGISPQSLHSKDQGQVIKWMKDKQFLLETKAPRCTDKKYICEGGMADIIADVAEKVAKIRISHRAMIMSVSRKNARAFFNI